MRVLGIESTCDETAAAVVEDGRRVRSSVVASQAALHAQFRGVVPEVASRAHIEAILPVLQEALADAGVRLGDIDAIAVAHRPGLIGSLLVGTTAAKALAWALGKPLVGVDHVHAHLYSVMLPAPERAAAGAERHCAETEGTERAKAGGSELDEGGLPRPEFPAVGLVSSGGHTALYHLESFTRIRLVGSTIDDAVGEAFDKVAAILGLGYPGGPIIDRLAQGGNPEAVRFPRSLLEPESLDFSFSGLKTSVLYHVRGRKGAEREAAALSAAEIADVAASFQAACVDVLVRKIGRAIGRFSPKSVLVGGGVSANSGLRAGLGSLGVPVFLPPLAYCTDNAAMIAGLGHVLLSEGARSPLSLEAFAHSERDR